MKSACFLPVVCLLLACKPTPPTPLSPPPPSAPPSSSTPSPASTLSLFERLASELASRPAAAAPRPEAVHAALAARGLVVEGWKQVLASPVGARFCMAGSTGLGVGVAVCEYDRPAAAAAGLARSRALFDRLIPDRQLVVRGTTLLTLTRPEPTGAAADQARRLSETFATL